MDKSAWYRKIPKVDILLEMPEIRLLREKYGHEIVMDKIRVQMEELRRKIGAAGSEEELEAAGESIRALPQAIEESVQEQHKPRVRKVINATGTILHTNLGRAPISREQAEKLTDIVTGYSNLEYDLAAGHRGERYSHFAQLLCRLTGAEDAMVVNNNAAAVMLVLSTLAKGGEVIVSRGELVEIGGKFRVPDVMAASGADLVEVGTTNKTHFSDYEEALTERTKALLKVHTSNYRIVGFTESVGIDELKPLAEAHGVPVIEDLGSGVLIDLEKYGLHHEPTVQESIRAGADVVCFSGDKLLGGPQAGIIIGKKKYIQAMKKNQLTRALRVDKFTVTALELVLLEYLNPEKVVQNVPVLRMITEPKEAVCRRAQALAEKLTARGCAAEIAVVPCESQIGGGSLPLERLPGAAVTIRPQHMSTAALEQRMLSLPVPVVGRAADDAVWLDARTLSEADCDILAEELTEVLA